MRHFSKHLLGLAICAALTPVQAEQLPGISVEDTLSINPNTTTPEAYNRSQALSADGGDFLKQLNGVSISRFGGRGIEPIIRGQSQNRLNVLLDGAYIYGGCPNRMDPPASWAALETYEEVTVLKGVQSVIYGAGGSGGTVLFERDSRGLAQEGGTHGRVSAAAASNGVKHDLLGDVMLSNEKGYVRLFAESKEAENYEDGDGREVRSAYKHNQGGFVLGYTPTEDRLIELTFERNDFSDALYPGAGMDSPEEEADLLRLRYQDKFTSGPIDAIKVETYISDVDHLMDNYSLRNAPKYPASHAKAGQDMKRATPTTSKTTGGRIVLDTTSGETTWQYGVDLQRNERDATLESHDMANPVAASFLWPDVTTEQMGIFAEAITPLDAKSTLKAGLRLDRLEHSAGNVDAKPMMASPNMAYNTYYGIKAEDQEETYAGGLLRYTRQLSDNISMFTGVSRSVRAADATELYINKWNATGKMRWVGNPGLEAEKHHQIDLGVSYKTKTAQANAVIFYDDVSDYILRDSARGQAGIQQTDKADIYRNVDATLTGIELDAQTQLQPAVTVSGSIAYVRATNTTDDDRNIAQTPPLNGKLQLDYDASNWSLGSRIRFAAKQDRIDELSKQEVGETDSWTAVDLYGNYPINDTFNLRAGIDNVFDETYAEHASRSNLMDPEAIKVNEPGRNVWLKLDAEF